MARLVVNQVRTKVEAFHRFTTDWLRAEGTRSILGRLPWECLRLIICIISRGHQEREDARERAQNQGYVRTVKGWPGEKGTRKRGGPGCSLRAGRSGDGLQHCRPNVYHARPIIGAQTPR